MAEKESKEFASASTPFDLLITKNFSFHVPAYQREYAWTETQIEDLWTDLFDFWEERDSDDDYLLGQVILSPKNKGNLEYFIVDGQQRFTTLCLLFAAARDFAEDNFRTSAQKEVRALSELSDALLFTMQSGTKTPRLTVTKGGQRAFLNLIGGERSHPNSADQSAQNIKDNYLSLIRRFEESFLEKKPSRLFSFIEMVLRNLILIVITLPSDEQALDFFERTNDRGLPLNQADLMKNLLFSKVSSTEYENISNRWADSVGTLRSIGLTRLKSMDFALKALLSEVSGESFARKRVFREWRRRLESGLETDEFLSDIGEVTSHLAQIAEQRDGDSVSEATTGSRYLNSIQQWTITSSARNLPTGLQAAIAEIVEARTILSAVVRERSQDFERVISPWASAVSKINSEAGSPKELALLASKKALEDVPNFLLNDLAPSLAALSYDRAADRKRMKLILAIVNREMAREINHDTSSFPLSTFIVSKTYDLEHIEPRSRVGSNKFGEDSRHLVDSIGNLTLWYKSDNRSKGDVDPSKKLSSYSQSSVLLTQILCPIDVLSGEVAEDTKWEKVGASRVNVLGDWGIDGIESRRELIQTWLTQYFKNSLGV